jgi:hypothetical protein
MRPGIAERKAFVSGRIHRGGLAAFGVLLA